MKLWRLLRANYERECRILELEKRNHSLEVYVGLALDNLNAKVTEQTAAIVTLTNAINAQAPAEATAADLAAVQSNVEANTARILTLVPASQ